MIKTDYFKEIQHLRDVREKRLKNNPQSWLALIGLFRLEEGDNPFGEADDNKIVLAGSGLARCGSFHLENGQITLKSRPELNLTVNDLAPEPRNLQTDHDKETDLIKTGSLTMMILQRGKNHYLRVWDRESPAVANFTGLKYYPIQPEYRVAAEFIPYDPPLTIKIQDVIGIEHDGNLAGEVHFDLHGITCRLVAESSEDELLFNFTDETRKDTTYPGGRYLMADKPKEGQVILDFNRATNWPCAYTAFATCPFPPVENRLPVRIEAGEMRYKDH